MTKTVAVAYRNMAGLSGVPNVVFAQASGLVERGHRVTLVAERLDRRRAGDCGAAAVKIPRLPGFKGYRARWFSGVADRIARRYDFVIGHGNNQVQDVLCVHNCARLYHERLQQASAADRDPAVTMQDRLLQKAGFKLCVVNSRLMRDDLQARYGLSSERTRVVYPGYDADRFAPELREHSYRSARERLGVADSQYLIGLVASGAYQLRGVDRAIRAMAIMPETVRQSSLLMIIGKNSALPEYRRMAGELGLEAYVRFEPPTRRIEDYFYAMDILVHPARLETFGMGVQEAMACGVPVVINKNVGAAELLPDRARDRLCADHTGESLAADLEKMIADQDWRLQWRQYSVSAAQSNTPPISFDAAYGVYREAGLS